MKTFQEFMCNAYLIKEEFKDLNPEKKKRVENRVGELARDIQVSAEKVKELRNKPFFKHRSGLKKQAKDITNVVRKKHNLVKNASDALIRTSVSRSAATQKRIEELKQKLRDHGEEP